MGFKPDYYDLVRFQQLYFITYPNGGSELPSCNSELKRQLMLSLKKVKPDLFSDFDNFRNVHILPENLIKSAYRETFPG